MDETMDETREKKPAPRRNLLLTIAYDGSAFCGWQRQPGVRTVQGELEAALASVLGQPVAVQGVSRTDAGVHALGQCASFSGTFGIPTERLQKVLNDRLAGRGGGPGKIGRVGDVRILGVREVPQAFHARFSARGKRYCYRIRVSEAPDIFQRRYCYQLTEPLDVEAMREAAAYLVGTHDFRSFQAAGSQPRETTVRTIYELKVEPRPDDFPLPPSGPELLLTVSGDGFLYQMVRILTGTLVEVGLGRRRPADMRDILDARDRQRAGHTAPPQGLYLTKVFYEEEIAKG